MAGFSIRTGVFHCPRITILAVLAVISMSIAAVSLGNAAQVTLAWNPSPEPSVTGYRVYYGTASHYYTAVIDAGNQTKVTISGLLPGVTYFFSATAYSAAAESSLSGEIAYTVAEGGSSASGSGSEGCFIATAAYGSHLASEVVVLRGFRDRYLLTSGLGRTFVDWYYRCSPPVAAFIKEHESLRSAVRWGLMPLVYAVKYPGMALALIVLVPFALVPRRRRRRGQGQAISPG